MIKTFVVIKLNQSKMFVKRDSKFLASKKKETRKGGHAHALKSRLHEPVFTTFRDKVRGVNFQGSGMCLYFVLQKIECTKKKTLL